MINIASPIIEEQEIRAVNEVLASGSIAQGPRVARLEAAFAKFCGTKFAVALNSGTAAIHCALYAAGVGPGDEVITTPFSFIASINPILMQGARPVLVDIRANDFNIDAAQIEAAITSETKAIVGVDLYGQPYDFDCLSAIAKKHNLILIEDACQSVGASFDGRPAGSLGDIGCFSLYATKNIMSAEGGVMTTDNEAFAKAAKAFRQHGMVGAYEYGGLGYNYRMTDILAAIGVEQLKKCHKFNEIRQRNAAIFDAGLKDIKGVVTPIVSGNRTHVYHQYTIQVTAEFPLTRAQLMDELRKEDIGSGIYYPKPLHLYPHIAKQGYKKGQFPIAEGAANEVLSLPVHPRVAEEDVRHITEVIRRLAGE